MFNIQILETFDVVNSTDWCRPLKAVFYDEFHEKSPYSGAPINNFKWIKVYVVFGKCWFNKTVKEITDSLGEYEFARGDIPQQNCMDVYLLTKNNS